MPSNREGVASSSIEGEWHLPMEGVWLAPISGCGTHLPAQGSSWPSDHHYDCTILPPEISTLQHFPTAI